MAVPYTFGNATTSIPLSQLDTNFATAITIGNTAVYLGNTTTTFGNVTLTNATISSGNVTLTSAIVPTVIGGTTASSTLTLQSTSGVGTSDAILFNVGNNGATNAMYINTSGSVGVGTSSPFNGGITIDSTTSGTTSANLYFKSQSADADEGVWRQRVFNTAGSAYFEIAGVNDAVSSASIAWRAVKVSGNVIDRHEWYTAGSERMRIRSDGGVAIGGSGSSTAGLYLQKNGTGAITAYGVFAAPTIQSDVTNAFSVFQSQPSTQATAFTLTTLKHFQAIQSTIGAGSAISSQTGFFSSANNIGATNNYGFYADNTAAVTTGNTAYGFYSNVNTATGGGTTYGFYAAGTAANVMPNLNGGTTASSTLTLQSTTGVGTSDAISFKVGNNGATTAMTINTSGQVGIGTSSPTVPLQIYNSSSAQVLLQGDASTNFIVNRNSTDASAPNFVTRKARGTTSAQTAVANGDVIGSVSFNGYGGTNFRTLSQIQGYIDTYTSDTNISSYLTFGTSSSGSAGATERMRIDSSGNLLVGTTTASTLLTVAGAISLQAPSTKTANYSMAATDSSLIFNGSGSITLTLQAASSYSGRMLYVKTIAAQTVVSASSNVVPLAGGAAGTAILAATAGKWAILQSDGTNWIIMASN